MVILRQIKSASGSNKSKGVVGSLSPCLMRTGGGSYIALICQLKYKPNVLSIAPASLVLTSSVLIFSRTQGVS